MPGLIVCYGWIGAGTQIGPGVHLLTADHLRNSSLRFRALEVGRPITIGRNVWIGAATLILSGLTISGCYGWE